MSSGKYSQDDSEILKLNFRYKRRGKGPVLYTPVQKIYDSPSLIATSNTFSFFPTRTPSTLNSYADPGVVAQQNRLMKLTKPFGNMNTKTQEIAYSSFAHSPQKIQHPLDPHKVSERLNRKFETEKLMINFKSDPLTYFSKHKDGTGHKFFI